MADPQRLRLHKFVYWFILSLYAAFVIFAGTGCIIGAAHGEALLGFLLGRSALAGLLLGAVLVGSTAFGLSIAVKAMRDGRRA